VTIAERALATHTGQLGGLSSSQAMLITDDAGKSIHGVTMAKNGTQPNILVIWGDDIGQSNLSCYTHGLMGYRTPNIDRIAHEGMLFTDSYGEQSCTAGRSSFITGQSVYRTGLSKVGIPASPVGMPDNIVTIAALLKEQGYATGQFGKNHLGDLNKHLPTAHGFDEFFGNLYHLNAEEEPEMDNYPDRKEFPKFYETFGPRGVIHSWASDKDDATEQPRWGRVGKQKIEDDGDVLGVRFDNWKMVFLEQRCQGTMQVWAEPFTRLRMPKVFNLRTDPPAQRPCSFTIDDAMKKMSEVTAGAS